MYQHSPLLQCLLHYAEVTPEKTAFIVDGIEVSYSSLLTYSRKAAALLLDRGVKSQDRIILSAHKDIEFIYLYLGAQILGVTNVIIDASSNQDRLNYIEQKSHPIYCFGYESRQYTSCGFGQLGLDNIEAYMEDAPAYITKDSIAEILFTTGTTGAPKGVCLSYANIFSSAYNVNSFVGNTADDIEILGLPICHSFGLGTIRCNIIKGATVVLLGNFANVRQFFKAIEQYHGTGFRVVPAAWAYIKKISGRRIEKYASQIKYIEIGSAAMPLATKKEMLKIFPNTRICMHYGLTEASRNCFVEFHDIKHLESIGKPVNDKVDVKIYNEIGIDVPVGQRGELCIKGNMVMAHYLEDEDNTNAFYGDYFRTGDTGYKGEDGYFYLLGREKELINVGGKKVSPMEVEDMICSLGVGDCLCVPMKDPDGIMGELVKCYILKDSTPLTFDEISECLQGRLENYKRPVAYEWIDEIPMTSSGKKQRLNLR